MRSPQRPRSVCVRGTKTRCINWEVEESKMFFVSYTTQSRVFSAILQKHPSFLSFCHNVSLLSQTQLSTTLFLVCSLLLAPSSTAHIAFIHSFLLFTHTHPLPSSRTTQHKTLLTSPVFAWTLICEETN